MTDLPKWFVESAPFAFAIFVSLTSFLQSKLIRTLVIRTIADRHGGVDTGVRNAIADYAVDVSQRVNYFVAILTSIIAGVVIGFNNKNSLLIIVSVLVLLGTAYVTILMIWTWELGHLLQGSGISKPENWLNLIIVAINVAFIAMVTV